jgi:hypothetical protein
MSSLVGKMEEVMRQTVSHEARTKPHNGPSEAKP